MRYHGLNGQAVTAAAIRRRQLDDFNILFLSLSSAGTVLGSCFGAVLQATLWGLRSPVLRTRRPRGRARIGCCNAGRYTRRSRNADQTHGPRALAEQDRRRQLPGELVPKLRRILTLLDEARSPGDLASQPGYRLHPLKGGMAGLWSIRVSGNWRVVFRFEDNEAVDVDLVDYHRTKRNGDHGDAESMPSGGDTARQSEGRRAVGDGGGVAAGLHPAGAVSAVEREGRDLAGDGTGAGGDRLEQRGVLDAAAGELRACAGAPGSGCRRTACGFAARMIGSRGSNAAWAGEPSCSTIPPTGRASATMQPSRPNRAHSARAPQPRLGAEQPRTATISAAAQVHSVDSRRQRRFPIPDDCSLRRRQRRQSDSRCRARRCHPGPCEVSCTHR